MSTSPTNTDIVTKREESWRLRYNTLLLFCLVTYIIRDTRIWRSSISVRFVWSVLTTRPSPPAATRRVPSAPRRCTSATTADSTSRRNSTCTENWSFRGCLHLIHCSILHCNVTYYKSRYIQHTYIYWGAAYSSKMLRILRAFNLVHDLPLEAGKQLK